MQNLKNNADNSQNSKTLSIKSFARLEQVEFVMSTLREKNVDLHQVSILSKNLDGYNDGDTISLRNKPAIEPYWSKLLGSKQNFGFLMIPNIGACYSVGAITPVLLDVLDEGKILGEFPGGLQGILLGFGAKKEAVSKLITDLNNNNYLMIFSGTPDELKGLDVLLGDTV